MGRVDFQVRRQLGELRVEAVVEVSHLLVENFRTGQVRPADVADEEHVAGQKHARRGRAHEVADQQRDGIGRMPGGEEHFHARRAGFENLAFDQGFVGVGHAGVGMDVDIRAGCRTQFLAAADVVGVHVGLDDADDAHALVTGDFQVAVDVAFGIDHHALMRGRTAEDVRETTQPRSLYLFEIHFFLLSAQALRPAAGSGALSAAWQTHAAPARPTR